MMKLRIFKHIVPAAAMLLAGAGISSCTGDLDVTPIDPGTQMVVDEVSLYTKCYANMALAGNTGADGDCDIDGLDGGTTGFVRQLWNANELTTDEAICAWGDPGIPDFNLNTWGASHPMLQGFYYRLYAGVNYCNHYLELCEGQNAQRTAEVRFLRALYYYYLMDCYGNVPFATALSAESPAQIQRADLFAWIESELMAIKDQLQEAAARNSSTPGYGRADQDAANLLLARMYLNAQVYTGNARWNDAKTYAEKVINGPHKLWTGTANGWTSYQMLFMGDNGENGAAQECILPVMQDGITTTSYGTTMFLMCSTWKSDMDLSQYKIMLKKADGTDSIGGDGNNYKMEWLASKTYGADTIVAWDCSYGTTEFWSGNRARVDLVRKFFPTGSVLQDNIYNTYKAAGDDRALFFGIDRTLEISAPGKYAEGYAVGKFRNTYAKGGKPHDSKFVDADFFLMRSAEAYLIAAEADARLNGDRTTACAKYIDELRDRAHAAKGTTGYYTLDEILDERAREFYFEGFRRTDLIRFGKFGGNNNYNWEWKGGVQAGTNFEAFRNIFALPAEDVNANPKLKQNDGY
jgi:hypothetical protein